MIDKILSKDIIKYLIILGILYTILKLLPSQRLTNKDIILLLMIIMIIFITIDYKCFKNNSELFSNISKLQNKMTPDKIKPQSTKPQIRPQPTRPQPTRPQPTEPQPTEPQPTEPQPTEPQPTEPQTPEPQTPEPQTPEPQTPEPQSPEPQTPEPQTPEPQTPERAIAPRTIAPRTTAPRTTAPRTTAPRTIAPRTTAPRTTAPRATEPRYINKLPPIKIPPIKPSLTSQPIVQPKIVTSAPRQTTTSPTPSSTPSPTPVATDSIKDLLQLLIKTQNNNNNIIPTMPVTLPTTGCSNEIEKIKQSMQSQIDELKNQLLTNGNTNYLDYLLSELSSSNIINDNETQMIKNKIKLNLLTTDEVIKSLETLKQTKNIIQNNTDFKYNELTTDYLKPIGDKIANEWDNDYTLLNTNKWTVPMSRPPVCINNTPCKVCPLDSSNIVSLKNWDNSRIFTNTHMNKQWVNNTTI